MNSNNLFPNIWRFAVLALVQVLLFKQVSLVGGEYFNIFLYPLFILFLPIELPTAFVVMLGFSMGLVMDMFYSSPGVHASAGAWSGFIRNILLRAYEPKAGFTGKELMPSPAYFGWPIFLQLASLFLALHLFWYFSVDAFTFVYFGTIALKTIAAWGLSMIFVVLYCSLFNPKN